MEFLIYLIKVNIAVAALYGMCHLFFRRDTFFAWKRAILLCLIMISVFYPFVDFFSVFSANVNILANDTLGLQLDEIILSPNSTNADKSIGLLSILSVIYFAGLSFFALRILIQTVSILNIVLNARKESRFGSEALVSDRTETPFSFLGIVVIDSRQYTESE